MSSTNVKKKPRIGKILLWVLAILAVLHIFTDGSSTDAILGLFRSPETEYTQPYEHPAYMGVTTKDAGGNTGALVLKVEDGSPAAIAGIEVGDIIVTVGSHSVSSASDLTDAIGSYQTGDRTRVTVVRPSGRTVLDILFGLKPESLTPPSFSQDGTLPSLPQISTQPSAPVVSTSPSVPPVSTPAAPAVDRLPSVPENLRNHVYLNMRGWGYCEKLTGKVVVTVLLVNDPEGAWSAAETSAVQAELQKTAARIISDAAAYGAQLSLSLQFKDASTSEVIKDGDTAKWMDSALASAGLPDRTKINIALERAYGAESAPVVFFANHKGRAYATHHSSQNEFAILYDDAHAFYHELSHLFGAKDFYYPDEVYDLANTHLPGSIMVDSSDGSMDDFTAYLIGWTDTLSDKAMAFLQSTAYLTQEQLSQASKIENYTGYATNHTNRSGTYTGYLVNGVRHGQGKWINSEGSIWEGNWVHGSLNGQGSFHGVNGNSYTGAFSDNKYHGQGTFTWADGGQYQGQWVNGVRQGTGTYTWANGATYTGGFANNLRSGEGTMIYTDGGKYQGQWANGKRHGQGTMVYSSGAIYTGQWAEDVSSGQGTYTWASGSKYVGGFAGGQFSGQGTASYTNGNVYTGQWTQGKQTGQGTMTYANGNSYVGSWADGTWNGKGTFTWTSGDKYVGDYVDGKRHGYGIYYYPSGNRYEGQWADNERNGQGTMYYANGTSKSGIWNNGKLES